MEFLKALAENTAREMWNARTNLSVLSKRSLRMRDAEDETTCELIDHIVCNNNGIKRLRTHHGMAYDVRFP